MKLLVFFGVYFILAVNFISYNDALEYFDSFEEQEPQFEDVDMEPAGYEYVRRRRSVPYNLPEESLLRRARALTRPLAQDCTLEECARLGQGFYGIKQCSNMYCRCSEDIAKIQSCPEGQYVFAAQIGICIDENLAKKAGHCEDYFKGSASRLMWISSSLPIVSMVFFNLFCFMIF